MPINPGQDPFDDDAPRQQSFNNPGAVGMFLFLAALTVLFASSLFAYVYVRSHMAQEVPADQPRAHVRVEWGAIHLPGALWVSTAMVIGVSIALALATRQLRGGRHRAARNSLTAATTLAIGFLTVQAPAMVGLLNQHRELRNPASGPQGTQLYGLIFFMVLLHALHVLGGMVALGNATAKAYRGGFANAGPDPVRHTAAYWHFLDVVWIVMFGLFYLMR